MQLVALTKFPKGRCFTLVQDKNYRTKVEIRRYLKENKIYGLSPLIVYQYLDDHGDSFMALRYAIVLSIISILEQNKE